MPRHSNPLQRPGPPIARLSVGLAAAALLAGCASQPAQPSSRPVQYQPASVRAADVYVYPASGQDSRQLDRDRYECHRWSVRQSGFDPSLPGTDDRYRMRVVESRPSPGAAVAAGAITGAVLGAAIAGPHRSGEGALVGATAGAILGAAAAEGYEGAERRDRRHVPEQQQRADGYRRAITACLEGRGYVVR